MQINSMSNKTRSILKVVAVLLVLLMVLMKLSIVAVPVLNPYVFWIMVIAFSLMLIASK